MRLVSVAILTVRAHERAARAATTSLELDTFTSRSPRRLKLPLRALSIGLPLLVGVACSSDGAGGGLGAMGGSGAGAVHGDNGGAGNSGASAGSTSSGGSVDSAGTGGSGAGLAGGGGTPQTGGSGGSSQSAGAGAAGNANPTGGATSTGHCLASAAELPTLKGLQDTDYYQQTNAAKGSISDLDFAWDASKNPSSGPPQHSQQAVSPEVPAGSERMQVYTPPGYDPNGTTRYPVLYLNHGTGDTYKVWLASSAGTGSADRNPGYGARIYENLLDKHATVPMIIVTAYIDDCGPLNAPTASNIKDDYGCTPKFKTAIIPKIDHDYRTIADRSGRAMAGLSRGGYVTLQTGVPNVDTLFSELYVYSAAYGASVAPDLTGYMNAIGNLLGNAPQTNAWLNQPLYIAIGSKDTTVTGSADTMNMQFATAGIKTLHVVSDGSHEWGNWRRYLHQSLQIMFRNKNGCQ